MYTESPVQEFTNRLETAYALLYKTDPEYAYSASRITAHDLAVKMVTALCKGSASKDGKGIKQVCTSLGLPFTYKAIQGYLGAYNEERP